MRQSTLLIETLKNFLRHQGITYKVLAQNLGQSESNIKRIFSEQSISLSGLEQMCDAAGIELFELAKLSRSKHEDTVCFTTAQEETLANDPKLFLFAYLILQNSTVQKIISLYNFNKQECQRYLLRLDKIGFIRLHAENRIEVLVSENVRWIEGGPLSILYTEEIKKEFMKGSFAKANERLRFLSARLSQNSVQVLSRRLDQLISEFSSLAEIDEIGGVEKTERFWLLLAYRPWSFSLGNRYRKKKTPH